MKKRLQYIDGASDKFWQIEVKGTEFTVLYGRNGTAGSSQIKQFESEDLCTKAAMKLIAEKEKKGYSESGDVAITISSNPIVAKKQTDTKILTDQIDYIVKNKRKNLIIPFFQENLKGNKEVIKKHIRKINRYWTDYVDLTEERGLRKKEYGNWGRRADDTQDLILFYFSFVTYNKDESRSISLNHKLNEIDTDPILTELMSDYTPDWLTDTLVSNARISNWNLVHYNKLIEFETQKYISYHPELFAHSLASFVNTTHSFRDKKIDCYEIIKSTELCLTRDIPELFNYETNIANMRDWGNSDEKVNRHWQNYFMDLINENLISKKFVIENCILVQTKEWNNSIKTFFKTLLLDLDLKDSDLIEFQDRIFTLLHNSYFPIVNLGIDLTKIIIEHPKFNIKSFLEYVEPVMMRDDCKGGIKKLIIMMDKLATSNPKLKSKISLVLAESFVISDLSLQERIAKLIIKLTDKKNVELQEKLANYQSQMMGNVKSSLASIIGKSSIEESTQQTGIELENVVRENTPKLSNPVILPKDKSEMLFHYGKWISSNDIIDSEIIVNSFILQQHFYDQEFREQFAPYHANIKNNYMGSSHKYFLANFIINKVERIRQAHTVKFEYVLANTLKLSNAIYNLAHTKIIENSTLPLLSMPTHYPYWIAPKTLIERMVDYEKHGEKMDILDLSIAIARMPRENVESAIPLVSSLSPKYKQLMEFCLGITDTIDFNSHSVLDKFITVIRQSNDKIDMATLWAVAATTFYPEKVFPDFDSSSIQQIPMVGKLYRPKMKFVEKNYTYTDWKSKKEIIANTWIEIFIEFPAIKFVPDSLVYSQDIQWKKKGQYDWYSPMQDGDVLYWLSINPQNSNALALWLINHSCKNADGAKADVKAFINAMISPDFHHSYYSTMLLAASFYMEKKEMRMASSEILYQLIELNTLDVSLFSEKLALFASNKYGVFQRFSESIVSIKDSSPRHNLILFQILDSVISEMNLELKLPTNFKKMVENYLDLKIKTNQPISHTSSENLDKIKENTSLKKIITQLIN